MNKLSTLLLGVCVVGAVLAGVAVVASSATATPSRNVSNSTAQWAFNDRASALNLSAGSAARSTNETTNATTRWAETQNSTTTVTHSSDTINIKYTVNRQPEDVGTAAVTATASFQTMWLNSDST